MAHRGHGQKGEGRPDKQNRGANNDSPQAPVQHTTTYLRVLMTQAQAASDAMTLWILNACPDLAKDSNLSELIKLYCQRFAVPKDVKSVMHGIRINGNYVRHPGLEPFADVLAYGTADLLAYQNYAHPDATAASSATSTSSRSHASSSNSKSTPPTSSTTAVSSSSHSGAASPSPSSVFPDGYYKKPCKASANCKKENCDYWHPHQGIPPGGVRGLNPDTSPAKECKHGSNCKIPHCKKWHPGNLAPSGGILPKSADKKASESQGAPRPTQRDQSPHATASPHHDRRQHHQQQRNSMLTDDSSQGSDSRSTDSRFPDGLWKRICHQGDDCKRANCKQWHPRDPLPPGGVRGDSSESPTPACKYDTKCTKPRNGLSASTASISSSGSNKPCEFWHSGQPAPKGGIVPVQSAIHRTRPCTRHKQKVDGCTFFHQDEDVPANGVEGKDIGAPEMKACPSGRQCTRIGKDKLWHPGEPVPPGGIAPPSASSGSKRDKEPTDSHGPRQQHQSSAGSPAKGPRERQGRTGLTSAKRTGFSQQQQLRQPGSGRQEHHRNASTSSGNAGEKSPVEQCAEGVNCDMFGCALRHGGARLPDCRYGGRCRSEECGLRHPEGWNPDASSNSSMSSLPSLDSSESAETYLKSLEQREQERQENEYAVYAAKDVLIDLISSRPTVLVRGHNGSGQVTQISQYITENFGNGLVVQLQSDNNSVRNVARQISFEFDGCEPGKNVIAHLHGEPDRFKEAKIIVMTSAEFVRASSNVAWMTSITAVVVSEVHQRLRFTDLALVICMEYQKKVKRAHPLRLVASSAMAEDMELSKALQVDDPFDIIMDEVHPIDTVKVRYTKSNDDTFSSVKVTADDDEDALAQQVLQLVNAVLLRNKRPGNILVFVPSNGDVKRSMDQFVALKNLMRREIKELARLQVLPLNGSMSADQQGQVANWTPEDDGDRLIVFSTNIAEHYVSVPDVALVIDTGKVRMATSHGVYEDVFISKSEAELRRSQAALADNGMCYRLYREADLINDSVEPEILRADLTYLCLVLIRAQFHPEAFPFITKPSTELLESKFRLLSRLSCVSNGSKPSSSTVLGQESIGKLADFIPIPSLPISSPAPELTARGEACLELGFDDPRWAAFVMEAYERFGATRLEHACDLAALLQGSSIFDSRKSHTEKQQLRNKQTLDSAHLDSDIQFHLQKFQMWVNTGKAAPGTSTCSQCSSPVVNDQNCNKCRSAYASEYGLESRSLVAILKESKRVLAIVKKFGTAATSDEIFKPWPEVLGRCLVFAFPEFIGEFLIPSTPGVGVFLPGIGDEGTFGQIDRSSAMLTITAGKIPPAHFLSMVQDKVKNQLMIQMCHPIKLEWLQNDHDRKALESSLLHFVPCYERSNVHKHYVARLKDYLQKTIYKKHAYVHYEPRTLQITVYAAEAMSSAVGRAMLDELQKAIDEDLAWEDYVPIGTSGTVTVTSGLQVTEYESEPSNLKRVKVYAPVSISDANAFSKWIRSVAHCEESDIAWKQFESSQQDKKERHTIAASSSASASPSLAASISSMTSTSTMMTSASAATIASSKLGYWRRASYVTFKSKDLARLFRERISEISGSAEVKDCNPEDPCLEEDRRIARGVPIHVSLPYAPSEALLFLNSLGLHGLLTRRVGNAKVPRLKITNVSPTDVDTVEEFLKRKVSPGIQITKSASKDCGNHAFDLMVTVDSTDMAKQCIDRLSESGVLSTPIVYNGAVFNHRFDPPRQGAFTPVYLKFTSPSYAQECIDRIKAAQVKGSKERPDAKGVVELHIDQWHLFDEVKSDMIASLKQTCPNVKVVDSPKGLQLEGSNVAQVRKATKAVIASTSPVIIRATQLFWRLFYSQLHKMNFRSSVPKALIEFEFYEQSDAMVRSVVVKGPQQSQAAALAELSDIAKNFQFKIIDIASVFTQFKTGFNGFLRLQKLIDAFKSKSIKIHLDYQFRSIAIYMHLDASNLAASSSSSAMPSQTSRSNKQTKSTHKAPKAAATMPDLQTAFDQVQSLVRELGGLGEHESTCVFCGKASPDSFFLICGHDYCGDCLGGQSTGSNPPITCSQCNTLVDVRNFKKLSSFEEIVQSSMKKQLNAPPNAVNPNLRQLCVCPSSDCGAIRTRPASQDMFYSQCAECHVKSCPSCGAIGDDAHLGKTCEQYTAHLKSRSFDSVLKDIQDRANAFLSSYTDTVLGKAVETVLNPGLIDGCPSMERFVAGVIHKGGPEILKQAFFAWHGTRSESIPAVLHEGFNPQYRSGQVYGPGEYFGQTAAVSEGYARGSTLIIVCMVLGGIPELSSHSNFCYVVKNPTDFRRSYVLPVLLARFDPLRLRHIAVQQQQILHNMAWKKVDKVKVLSFEAAKASHGNGREASSSHASSSSSLAASATGLTPSDTFVRWEWYYDDPHLPVPKFEPYKAAASKELEDAYQAYQYRQGPPQIEIQVIRYVGDTPQDYTIDLKNMKQLLKDARGRTLKARSVQRTSHSLPSENYLWEYLDDSRQWAAYDNLATPTIEGAFQSWRTGGISSVQLAVPGRPEGYVIDFLEMKQKNTSNSTARHVRRTVANNSRK